MRSNLLLLTVVSILYLVSFLTLGSYEKMMENGDSSGYYLHVVSTLLYGDVGAYDESLEAFTTEYPDAKYLLNDPYWIKETDLGIKYVKYTLGVGIMEAPAFLVAHAYAHLDNSYPPNGWSRPYVVSISIFKILYVLLGFWLLMKVLSRYFDRTTVWLTIIAVAFATNLFYHINSLALAHPFLFFDICLLIYLSENFYKKPNTLRSLAIGLVVGLITITRVPEIISIMIPIFWGIDSRQAFKRRIKFFQQDPKLLVSMVGGILLAFSPQLFYWHYVSGDLIFNPYQGEGFDLLSPEIVKGWFHFNNGWLIYTPIMLFSLIGLYMLRKKAPGIILPALSFVVLNAWIHYSYYVWNYYPGLGSRPMIEAYPLLAFGLAAFFGYFSERKKLIWIPFLLLAFFTWLNIHQTWQMKQGLIWTQHSSPAFYYHMFGKNQSSIEALRAFDSEEIQPDTSKITLVQTIHFNDYEDPSLPGITNEHSYSGQYSIMQKVEEPNVSYEFKASAYDLRPGDWLYVGIKAYRKPGDVVWDMYKQEMLVVRVVNDLGKQKKRAYIRIPRHIQNETNTIWHSGKTNTWDEAGFYIRLPRSLGPDWKIDVHVLNKYQNKLFMDDLVIRQYRVE